MNRVIQFMLRPDVRVPLAVTLSIGLLVGFVVGVFAVRNPEHTYLLREIQSSVRTHTCSSWAVDAEREDRQDEVYRAVAQALVDWESASGRLPGG